MHSLRLHAPPQPPIWCYTMWTGYSEKSPYFILFINLTLSCLSKCYCTYSYHSCLQTTDQYWPKHLLLDLQYWPVYFVESLICLFSRPPLIPVLSPSKWIIYCNFVSIKSLRAVRVAYTHINCTPSTFDMVNFTVNFSWTHGSIWESVDTM